jgi:hypothetical protein
MIMVYQGQYGYTKRPYIRYEEQNVSLTSARNKCYGDQEPTQNRDRSKAPSKENATYYRRYMQRQGMMQTTTIRDQAPNSLHVS